MTLAWHSGTGESGRVAVGRWGACLILVLVLHGLGALALLRWRSPVIPLETMQAAIMIDLPPLPAPAAPVSPPPEPVPQAVPEPVAPPAPQPVVALPPPKPKPAPRRVEPAPQPAPAPSESPSRPEPTAAPPRAPPMPPPQSAAPSYQGLLLAQLERNKRYPREARMQHQEGVAILRFTLERDGRLRAFRLERSSGHRVLDDEVLAMIQRAAPLPPFPPEMTEAQLELVVPIRFSLR
jgi:periplasmic protein TonB